MTVGRSHWMRWFAALIVTSVLALVSIVSLTRLGVVGSEQANPTDDINSAQRYMAYRIDRSGGPRFTIESANSVIKVLAVAAMPANRDGRERLPWGFEVAVIGKHGTWNHVMYTESRQSHDGAKRGTYELQGGEYSDERELRFTLPSNVEGELSLRLMHDSGTEHVLARLFVFNPRPQERIAQRRSDLESDVESEEAEQLVEATPVIPHVSLLSPHNIDYRLAQRFAKLLPIGDDGVDYQMRQILIGRFRQAPPEIDPLVEHKIDRYHWLAINVRGPGTITITHVSGPRAWRVGSPSGAHDGVDKRTLGSEDSIRVPIADAVTSLWIQSDSSMTDVVSVHSDGVAQVSPSYRVGTAVVGPDIVRMPVEIADAQHAVELGVVDLPLRPGMESAIRVDVRQLLSETTATASDGAVTTKVAITFKDAAGKPLLQQTAVVTSAVSPFEQVAIDGGMAAVTEPHFLRVLPPQGCRSISISSERRIALRFSRRVALPDKVDEPYLSALLNGQRWRYARMQSRQWQPFFSLNAGPRQPANRKAVLLAQVRLIDVSIDDQLFSKVDPPFIATNRPNDVVDNQSKPIVAAAPDLRSLAPFGNAEQQRIRETVDDSQRAGLLSRWSEDAVTVLRAQHGANQATLGSGVHHAADDPTAGANSSTRIRFTEKGVDDAAIGWRCDLAQLGSTAIVYVDGVEFSSFDLTTSSGSWKLPSGNPSGIESGNAGQRGLTGDHDISVRASDNVSLWINRPPAGASAATATLLRMKVVWSLSSAPVMARVPQRQGDNVNVYAVVYGPGAAADESIGLRFTVGGGSPLRAVGVLPGKMTLADRRLTLPMATKVQRQTLFVDRPGAALGLPRIIRLGLLDDLRGGNQVVSAYATSRKPLWIRFLVAQSPSDPVVVPVGVKVTRDIE